MSANNLEVFFVSSSFRGSKSLGSYKMRALETIDFLSRIYNTKFISISLGQVSTLPKESTSKRIFVIVKPYKKDLPSYHFIRNELQGTLILDFIDSVYLKRSCLWAIKYPDLISALILPNIDAENFVNGFNLKIPSSVIYHHAHFPKEIKKQESLSFCYLGKPGCNHITCPDVQQYSFSEENLNKAATYQCHTSYRITKKYKPNTKICVAANCNSNIVINKSSGGVETLPKEYSYICDDNEYSFLEMISKVKRDYGSPEWKSNLEIMEWYKNEYSLEKLSKMYYNYIISV